VAMPISTSALAFGVAVCGIAVPAPWYVISPWFARPVSHGTAAGRHPHRSRNTGKCLCWFYSYVKGPEEQLALAPYICLLKRSFVQRHHLLSSHSIGLDYHQLKPPFIHRLDMPLLVLRVPLVSTNNVCTGAASPVAAAAAAAATTTTAVSN